MSLVTIIVSILLAALACWGMASLMNSLDNTMSWYNTTFLSIGIYCSLALIVQIATYHVVQLISTYCLRTKKYREASKRHRVKMNLNGVTLFWSILTITLTAMGMRIGYIFMILLFVSLCTYLLTYLMCRVLSKTSKFINIQNEFLILLFLCNCLNNSFTKLDFYSYIRTFSCVPIFILHLKANSRTFYSDCC